MVSKVATVAILILLSIDLFGQGNFPLRRIERSPVDSMFVMTDVNSTQQYITITDLRAILADGGSLGGNIYVQPAMPVLPVQGDIWKETQNGYISIFHSGAFIAIGQDRTMLAFYDDDADAQANGLNIDDWYKLTADNKVGGAFGEERERKY